MAMDGGNLCCAPGGWRTWHQGTTIVGFGCGSDTLQRVHRQTIWKTFHNAPIDANKVQFQNPSSKNENSSRKVVLETTNLTSTLTWLLRRRYLVEESGPESLLAMALAEITRQIFKSFVAQN
jgi:hypothetical protein